MTYPERDAWDVAGDSGNGIEGQHLKCAKGTWLLDDEEIETGDDGIKVCVIMDTATVGYVRWADQKIVERNTGRLSDNFPAPAPAEIETGWNPYTAVMGVRADDGHLGELITFTSSSWGGWYAFQRLINPWRLKGRAAFPVCTLSTKERRDENRNVDPVFKHTGWSARRNFAELLPPPATEAAALEYSYDPANDIPPADRDSRPAKLSEILGDDIPF